MRTRAPISLLVLSIAACGGEAPVAKGPAATRAPGAKDGTPIASGVDVTCKGPPKVGNPASPMKFNPVNGGSKAEVAPGKVTLVDLWATWCEPCKKSFPKYQELYVKYKASGLEILAVSLDEEEASSAIPGFAKTNGDAKFPLGWDSKKVVGKCYSPPKMPSAYIIDKKGVLRFVHNGYHDGEEREIEKEIKELL